jgi:hypothetical protein
VLPQEFRIDFLDASVTALEDLALDSIDTFRVRGFRVGLDARRTWRTTMGARARATFEAVRIDPERLVIEEVPLSRLEAASADGVAIVAHNVLRRDADALAEIGVFYAAAPQSDA